MTEVPKIVHDRLRAALPDQAAPGESHPDADLLTAFAERALSASEREGVLVHLARCGDCRELIALALPAAEPATVPAVAEASRAGAPPRRKLSFAWPTLRWAALAAGVAVAAAVLLMHPGKLNQGTEPPINPQVATTAQPVHGPQTASAPLAPQAMDQSAVSARADAGQPRSELRMSRKLDAAKVATPTHQAESGMLLAESKIAVNKHDLKEADKLSEPSSAGAQALNYNAPAVPRSNETVEVTAESPAVQAEVFSDAAQNAREVVKAKPAPQAETSQPLNGFSASAGEAPLQGRNMASMAKLAAPPSPTRARNVTWTIAAGVLQRSLDSGQNWQPALHADHPLLCYAPHDQDFWAGGQAGTLFHSADGGVTWLRVQPSVQGQALTSDITHIEVRASAEVVISTSNHEIWSSADNGKTWEKK